MGSEESRIAVGFGLAIAIAVGAGAALYVIRTITELMVSLSNLNF